MSVDILQTDFDWDGQDVYVVGSGPNAEPYMISNSPILPARCLPLDYTQKPPSSPVSIACNKGILSRSVPTFWLCATPALPQLEWFRKAMVDNKVPVIARRGTLLEAYPDIPYYFNDGPSLWSDANRNAAANSIKSVTKYFGCTEGLLRGGASAVARAVQLAWFKKAKRCVLIGADMKGRVYFDGTINETKRNTMDDKGHWFELPFFNELIKWVKARGMDVVSLTPTALDVEVI